jgi:geranylgeranyl diphosphate synthase type I
MPRAHRQIGEELGRLSESKKLTQAMTASRAIDVDALIDPYLEAAIQALDGEAPLLTGMARYHMGWVTPSFEPVNPGAVDRGKRIRPLVALLSCAAASGDPADAAPLAAAIELLHNFTLIHDDIQDQSPTRRHRATVWSLWGHSQAINAGDALFASAHLALYRLRERGVPDALVLRLADAFDRTTIAIVRGQVLDLQFEGRNDVSPGDYHRMIAGKTAAIVRFAAWGGALVGGASEPAADRLAAFGLALGLGFQVRDDLLGIWGEASETGKAAADDIRRRKQSLPILMLRERASEHDRAELEALYRQPEISADGVNRVLALLAAYDVRSAVEAEIAALHDQARAALLAATGSEANPARDALLALVEMLADRRH